MINWKKMRLCGLLALPFIAGCASLEKACSGKMGNHSRTDSTRNGDANMVAEKESYPEISRDALFSLLNSGKVLVIDGNGTESFSEGHIPGALDFEASGPKWPEGLPEDRNAMVVAYCGGPRCMAWKAPAQALTRLGYINVYHYSGGLSDWEEFSMPMERVPEKISPITSVSKSETGTSIPTCKLSPMAQAKRIKDLRSDLFTDITSITEAEGALVFRFRDDPKNASALTEFIRVERQCCSSLRFRMIWESNPGPISLEIRGPKEVLTAFKQIAQAQ